MQAHSMSLTTQNASNPAEVLGKKFLSSLQLSGAQVNANRIQFMCISGNSMEYSEGGGV